MYIRQAYLQLPVVKTKRSHAIRLRLTDQQSAIHQIARHYSDFHKTNFAVALGSVIMRCYHAWKCVRTEPQNSYRAGFLGINWHDNKMKKNGAAAQAYNVEHLDTTLRGEGGTLRGSRWPYLAADSFVIGFRG
jgi:hypothetical protein